MVNFAPNIASSTMLELYFKNVTATINASMQDLKKEDEKAYNKFLEIAGEEDAE